jgi:D-3-phosphoglycerate dehydrogenase / 2-oxoglutarate reductase
MKILISDAVEQGCVDIFQSENFEVDNRPGISPEEVKKIIPQYEGLVVRSATKVTADVIALGVRLKVIGRAGTGVDNIDVPAATRRGILVMNTPGGNTVSAAEHAVSMLMSLARNIPQAHQSLVRGEWERKKYTGTEVFEKTLGVIGLGKIGREVALRCKGLGMRVIGYDPVIAADAASKLDIELVPLEELYRRSDFITVHTPLTPDTKGLLNDATLARCKKGVRLINCARGGIIDEGALLRALESGRVAGAALDVFETEPPKGNPLLVHPRLIATPHLGASTEEAQEKVALQIAHQIVDALRGRAYTGVVNGAVMGLTLREEIRPLVVLAEKMGSMVAQLAEGKLKRLTVGAAGEQALSTLELLKAGVIKGVLSHVQPDPVNYISAPFLAAELGLVVNEEREGEPENYGILVRVRYETERGERQVAGTVFGRSGVRFVQIDGFRFEVNPEGNLLVYNNVDRPGMLARVGSVLSKHGVNIAGVSLGRAVPGGNALTVMNIDSSIPSDGMNELNGLEGVSNIRLVRLD